MISTASYYCTEGHVYEVTTDTWGHDAALDQPCLSCVLALKQEGDKVGGVRGPFPDMGSATRIATARGVSIKT